MSLLVGSFLFLQRHVKYQTKKQNKRKHILLTDFSVRLTVCLSLVTDRKYSSMSLGKVRQKNPLLSGFPISAFVIQKRSECLS